MKKSKYIIALFLSVVCLTSCDDFLDVESESSFDTKYVFSTPNDAKKAVLGVYALFTQDTYTSRMSCVFMQNTDIEVTAPGVNPDGSRRDVWSLQGGLLSGFGDIFKAWQDNYLAIDRANQCIEGILASPQANNENMKMLLGEAYCLRAYRYFLLCNYWGDVPYFREAAKTGMELDRPKTDKNIIYSGMIQDLINCEEEMFFADQFADGIERMNREFAMGLIARLSLFRAGYGMTKEGVMKRAEEYLDVNNEELTVTYTYNGAEKKASTSAEYYQLAKDYCQKLISERGRDLPNFARVFRNQCEFVKPTDGDILYEVAFGSVNSGGDVGWCIGQGVYGGSKGKTTIQVGLCPTYYYLFDPKDTRRDVTISKVRYNNNTEQAPESITGLTVGKWSRMLLPTDPGEESSKGTGINWPLLRYSDILLMLAEAENELNGPTALAKEMLSKVRERAFSTEDHAEKVANYINKLGAKSDFFEAIVTERALEFGGECLRKFDLVRWNNYGKKIVETKKELDNMGKAALEQDLENPEVAKYKNYADKLYFQRKGGTIIFLNDFYKPETVPTQITTIDNLEKDEYEGFYATVDWTRNLYRKITDPKTEEVTYESADYTTRCWRGYKDPTGVAAVPYLLAISSQTIETSEVLTNEGYGHATGAN